MINKVRVLARNCAARSSDSLYEVFAMLSDKSSVVLSETGGKWIHAFVQT